LSTSQPVGQAIEGIVIESQGLMVSRNISVTVSLDVVEADAVVTPTLATAAAAPAVTRTAAAIGPRRRRWCRGRSMLLSMLNLLCCEMR